MTAFPKPVRAAKKARQPLRRGQPLKRSRMKPGKRGTAHSRRKRENGFMHFCHERGCELALDLDMQRVLSISHDCAFEPVEFAHLSDLKRYDPAGDIGACLCRTLHKGLDGNRIGGKPAWYAALDHQGQHTIRMRLANRARMAWDAITDAQRDEWEEKARAWRAARYPRGRAR